MKATEQYFHVVLFIMPPLPPPPRGRDYVVHFGSLFRSLWTKPWCVTIQMKAIEQYFHVVLSIMLYKVVRTFESVAETQAGVWQFE